MDKILKRIQEPVFPNRQFVITDFGAKDDGTMSTEAFRKAIEACNKAGGGRVLVPKGTYLTGAIHLLSNVELHVSEGATILFSINPKDYLPVVHTRYEASELYNYSPLIYAYKQENIAITGKGKFDNQSFWNKAPYALAILAKKSGKPVYAIVGINETIAQDCFNGVYSLVNNNTIHSYAMSHAGDLVYERAADLAEELYFRMR
jgi:polygalacturonase